MRSLAHGVVLIVTCGCGTTTFVDTGTDASRADASTVGGADGGPDAAVDAADAQAVGPPSPGTFRCDGAPCDSRTSACCPSNGGCLTIRNAEFACDTKKPYVACDEPADCQEGQVCCLAMDSSGQAPQARCADPDDCSRESGQLCTTDADCAGKRCIPIHCFGQTLGSCDGVTLAPCK